jgi:hypothetical protein
MSCKKKKDTREEQIKSVKDMQNREKLSKKWDMVGLNNKTLQGGQILFSKGRGHSFLMKI